MSINLHAGKMNSNDPFIKNYKGNADMLKPDHFLLRKKLVAILDEIAVKNEDFDIDVEEIKVGGGHSMMSLPKETLYKYDIDLPHDYEKLREIYEQKTLFDRNSFFPYAEFYNHLRNPKYSYYCYLFLLTTDKERLGPPPAEIKPLFDKDKKAWDKNIEKHVSSFNCFREHVDYSYPGQLFLEVTDKQFRDMLVNDWGQFYGFLPNSMDYVYGKTKIYGVYGAEVSRGGDKRFKPFLKFLDECRDAEKKNIDYSVIEPTIPNVKTWLYLVFAEAKEKDKHNFKAFMDWLHSQKKFQPLYSAVMMSLFIVKGYDFDEMTGKYIPNDMGREMLDYIVETPIRENAERLKIIRDGGNEELISSLMKKYNTADKWNELTKNAVK
jgi:hypothetical protein